jgi:parallel beta-helix repeat protein
MKMSKSVTNRVPLKKTITTLCAVLFAGAYLPAEAAVSCVNPAGTSGCKTTIGAAVTSAAAGDTIQVGAGTYKEAVTITKSLSLIGAGSSTTIIDATGLPNGIAINGSGVGSGPSVTGVVITGFTVQNANFQGILAQNVTAVTIWNNQVLNNDKSLNVAANPPACPGLPAAFQAGEGEDCGEGIHLTGVDHSVVSNNVVKGNSGGILISDDTGTTHDNQISGNVVSNNFFDCGITLASHSGAGVYHNTISGNLSSGNGTKLPGAGAGVGIFAPGPGSKAYGNVVINNTITGNGLPGVTMHNHAAVSGAPPVVFDDNVIIGNVIFGNAADTQDAATPGPTGINIYSVAPINGTVVTQNVVSQEFVGLAFKGPGTVIASLNNFMTPTGVFLGAGQVIATQNWWGCPTGPNTPGCGIVPSSSVIFTAPLTGPFNGTQLPSSATPPPAGGSGTGITIVVTGPGGATSPTNFFQTVSNQLTLSASQSTSSNAGALTYAWTSNAGYALPGMSGANTATVTLQLPTSGAYQLTLTVTDATGVQATAIITIQDV